jgi:hypothetical protein
MLTCFSSLRLLSSLMDRYRAVHSSVVVMIMMPLSARLLRRCRRRLHAAQEPGAGPCTRPAAASFSRGPRTGRDALGTRPAPSCCLLAMLKRACAVGAVRAAAQLCCPPCLPSLLAASRCLRCAQTAQRGLGLAHWQSGDPVRCEEV